MLLYELLTGLRPYTLESRSLPEVHRVVCETEPAAPSTVVSTAGAGAEHGREGQVPGEVEHSRARSTSPERLRRRLEGDLDTIVLRALRKEPGRRYGSVAALAEDLRRHLEGLPVTARPDTFWYRASRFARRNRVGVAAAAIILILVLGFAVAMGLQARRTARERDKAEHVATLLVDLFEISDPYQALGESVTAREILDRGSERVRAELRAEPDLQAAMMDVIGRVYLKLGLFDDARPLLADALELRRATLGPRHVDVAASLHNLGDLLTEIGEEAAAEEHYLEALGLRRQLLGEPHR